MTVKELIRELMYLDDEAEIIINNNGKRLMSIDCEENDDNDVVIELNYEE